MHFCLWPPLKRPKLLMQVTVYDVFFCQRFRRSTLETERFHNDFFSTVFKTLQFGILCGGFRRLSAAFAVIQVSTIGENVSKK